MGKIITDYPTVTTIDLAMHVFFVHADHGP
jgi:hypothetical protein